MNFNRRHPQLQGDAVATSDVLGGDSVVGVDDGVADGVAFGAVEKTAAGVL